jgi:hypothetical protein
MSVCISYKSELLLFSTNFSKLFLQICKTLIRRHLGILDFCKQSQPQADRLKTVLKTPFYSSLIPINLRVPMVKHWAQKFVFPPPSATSSIASDISLLYILNKVQSEILLLLSNCYKSTNCNSNLNTSERLSIKNYLQSSSKPVLSLRRLMLIISQSKLSILY